MTPGMRAQQVAFKPRSRLLILLGDQLIRDPGIAVFELVKNAYDADASEIVVTLTNADEPESGSISIEDNGTGMDWDTVTRVWLEPGTDYRVEQRTARKTSHKFGRLPLGEKGVGRFAAHKLGSQITMITRMLGQPETRVEIDWTEFEKHKYLSDARIKVEETKPKHFTGDRTGTLMVINRLRTAWTRGMIRDLYRAVISICSPFAGPENFKTTFRLEPDEGQLEGLLKVSEILEYAPFNASCVLKGSVLTYDYTFRPPPGMQLVAQREIARRTMEIVDSDGKKINLSASKIGTVKVDLRIFDRDPRVLAFAVTDKKGLKEFLDTSGGIRVYRNGVRIYDFGESGNDWLGLGGRRVNIPTQRISNNQVIGVVSLDLAESQDLVEKTNREGFVENAASKAFRDAVLFAVQQIEAERNIDKQRIRAAYGPSKKREPVLDDLAELREKLRGRNLDRELEPYISRVESDFLDVRDRLLTVAGAGLSLAVVIHEVEKGISELSRAVERETSPPHVVELARHLSELIEGLTFLIRKSGQRKERASTLVKQALFNTEYRTKYHNIKVINGFLTGSPDFEVKCSRRLIVATLMNLIDNSIWWLDNKGATDKRTYVGSAIDLAGGPAIIVADNGPGFIDPPEYLVQPFFSRKPDGMGLGLHLANEVMKAHGGRLDFPDPKDLTLPEGIHGAVVALVFGALA